MSAGIRPGCRGCGAVELTRVLDLGKMPAADDFPPLDAPFGTGEATHPLAMDLCPVCGLAQLAEDDTVTAEPRGVEPRALRDQAAAALDGVAEAGWLSGATAAEFGSPHGGSWLPLLESRGFTVTEGPADVVVDCFGIMHEPDQRAAFTARAAATAADGALLLQFHSLAAIVEQGQWNALRHGHFAYYSLHTLRRLLAAAGMRAAAAWEFSLYGGTVLVAAVHGPAELHSAPADPTLARILAAESAVFGDDPETAAAAVRGLQRAADSQASSLRAWLERETASGHRVFAYGAASRAVALLHLAGVHQALLTAVADASPAKQGRRMPGTDVPIIAPAELVAAQPDRVLLTLPDLLPEIRAQWPELEGRWVLNPTAQD
ncbi:methyltransferase C-terminal domain-containing protein [Nocardia sp. NBC_01503]|uniref:class I SAM-dependent methyltransferase n=1 Tax=Nocardia sp. NBC_01503 TaxID=2975997 RepID=UPI002E7B89A3|nr:methyltransferase domain-containing protein [Nocardia sp. NBC_01503]WTL31844.1 methyltransferase C-terminal domain-containing protein [Nocardia sp. NBC_01503]